MNDGFGRRQDDDDPAGKDVLEEPERDVDKSAASAASLDEFRNNCRLYVAVLDNPSMDLGGTLDNFETWVAWIQQGNGTPAHVAHFYCVAIPEMAHAVLKRHYAAWQIERVNAFLSRLLEAVTLRLEALGPEISAGELGLLAELLNPHHLYYKRYGCAPMRSAPRAPADAEDQWLDALGKGDYAEAFLPERSGWYVCRILQTSPTDTEVEVEVWDERVGGAGDDAPAARKAGSDRPAELIGRRWFAKEPDSIRVQRPATVAESKEAADEDPAAVDGDDNPVAAAHVQDEPQLIALSALTEDAAARSPHAWRLHLRPGQMLDARNRHGAWLQAVVVKVEPAAAEDAGVEHERLLVAFIGCASSADEWVARGCPDRLAPLNWRSEGAQGPLFPRALDVAYSECSVDDSADPPGVFAMLRQARSQSTSVFLVHNINRFGAAGGFQAAHRLLTAPGSSVHIVQHVIMMFSRLAPWLSAEVVTNMVPDFLEDVHRCMLQLDQSQVRLLSRGCVNDIVEGSRRLLYRIDTWHGAGTRAENLALCIIGKQLECKAIMQRLDGMSSAIDWVDKAKNAAQHPSGLRLETSAAPAAATCASEDAGDPAYGPQPQQKGLSDVVASMLTRVNGGDPGKPATKQAGAGSPRPNVAFADDPAAPADPGPGTGTGATGDEAKPAAPDMVYVRVPVAHWVTRERLAVWLLEQRAVEQAVQGPLAHHEMVKRSTALVHLLVETGKLSDEMVALFWDAMESAAGSDQELVDAIYALLGETVSRMSAAHLAQILRHLAALAPKDYSRHTLELLRELCKCTQRQAEGKQPNLAALDLLWRAVQADFGLKPRLVEAGMSLLEEVIKHYASLDMMRAFRTDDKTSTPAEAPAAPSASSTPGAAAPAAGLSSDQVALVMGVLSAATQLASEATCTDDGGRLLRECLIERCLANLRAGRGALQAQQVMQLVLTSFPAAKVLGSHQHRDREAGEHLEGWESREQVFAWLNERHDVINLWLSELSKLKEDSVADGADVAWYAEQLRGRLEALTLALNDSGMTLSKAQVQKLWDTFVAHAQGTADKVALFDFLRRSAANMLPAGSEGHRGALSTETLECVFLDELCQLESWASADDEDVAEAGFRCFRTFFLKTNLLRGHIRRGTDRALGDGTPQGRRVRLKLELGEDSEEESLQVVEMPLLGQGPLLHIALESGSAAVATEASQLLCKLLLLFDSPDPQQVVDRRREFISECMRTMAASPSTGDSSGRIATRCIALLRPLLELTEAEAAWTCEVLGDEAWEQLRPHCKAVTERSFDVYISNNVRGSARHGDKVHLRANAHDPVWRFRQTVASVLELDQGPNKRRLRIFAGGKEIKPESGVRVLCDLPGFTQGINVLVCEKPQAVKGDEADSPPVQPVEISPEHDREQEALARVKLSSLPARILAANQDYFEQLFVQLKSSATTSSTAAEAIWQLLEALPTDETLRQDLELVAAPILAQLEGADPADPKLLYILHLVEAKVGLALSDAEAPGPAREQWYAKFAAKGGFASLAALLPKVVEKLSGQSSDPRPAGVPMPFGTSKLLRTASKLCKLCLHGSVGALLTAGVEPDSSGPIQTLMEVLPDPARVLKLQREIDISGVCMLDPKSVFPFAEQPGTVGEPTSASPAAGAEAGAGAESGDAAPVGPASSSEQASGEPCAQDGSPTPTNSAGAQAAEAARGVALPPLLAQRATLHGAPWPAGDGQRLVAATGRLLAEVLFSPSVAGGPPGEAGSSEEKECLLELVSWGMALWAVSLSGVEAPLEDPHVLPLTNFATDGVCCRHGPVPFVTRQVFRNGMLAVCKHDPSADKSLLDKTLGMLIADVAPPCDDFSCDEYFDLCDSLVGMWPTDAPDRVTRLVGYAQALLERLRAAPVVEEGPETAPVRTDWALIGRLKLLKRVLEAARPHGLDASTRDALVDFLLRECLFPPPTRVGEPEAQGGLRRCCRFVSRTVAFELVQALVVQARSREVWARLGNALDGHLVVEVGRLQRFMSEQPAESAGMSLSAQVAREEAGWEVQLGAEQRALCGYAGLVNLGFICYMNSLIQQLYMVPRLRYGLLVAAPGPPGQGPEGEGAGEGEHTRYPELLAELQRMFAELDMTVKKAYNPTGWCEAFKDEAGEPVNVWVQQDAHEFFNKLCDRLDETLAGGAQDKLVSRTLGVTIANQLICIDESEEGAGLERENAPVTEYCLTQEILSSSTNLHESLESFVAGEVLNDYRWEERDNAKLRTLKRQCIADLNDVVFIHLKRFRLNWETFMTEKINSRFEFPLELDLFPFTKEGLAWKESSSSSSSSSSSAAAAAAAEDDSDAKFGSRGRAYYQYQLAGVVVHSGATLNGGHYYSFIRAKLGQARGQWFEFNDRTVQPFDLAQLEDATFGGGVRHGSMGVEVPSVNNAYMLVYERCEPQQQEEDFLRSTSTDTAPLREVASLLRAKQPLTRRLKAAAFPSHLFSALSEENDAFESIYYRFGGELRRFMCSLLADLAREDGAPMREAALAGPAHESFLLQATTYVVNTVCRARHHAELPEMVNSLCALFRLAPREHARASLDMILDHAEASNLLAGALLVQNSQLVRDCFAQLCAELLLCAPIEDEQAAQRAGAVLSAPLRNGLCRSHWRRWSRYWSVVRVAAESSPALAEALIGSHVVTHVVDVFLGKGSVFADEWDDGELGTRVLAQLPASSNEAWDWDEPFACARALVERSWPFHEEAQGLCAPASKLAITPPSTWTVNALFIRRFYEDALELCNRRAALGMSTAFARDLGRMLQHVSFAWDEFSSHAVLVVLRALMEAPACSVVQHFELLQGLLDQDDGLLAQRLDALVLGDTRDLSISSVPVQLDLVSILRTRLDCDDVGFAFAVTYCQALLGFVARNPALLERVRQDPERLEAEWLPAVDATLERMALLRTGPGPRLAAVPGTGETAAERVLGGLRFSKFVAAERDIGDGRALLTSEEAGPAATAAAGTATDDAASEDESGDEEAAAATE